MNIVKGVADLIRRTSSGQPGESGSWSQSERFSVPSPRICFSEVADEAILNTLWKRHENANDKVEKRRLFHIFLKQFLLVYETWEPAYSGQLSEAGSSSSLTTESSSGLHDTVVGCSAGHPAEIILSLTQEIQQLTSHVAELNSNTAQCTADFLGASLSLNVITEGLLVLDALTIITRSMHNCRIFGYYGGIQKLTALMKAAVVQLKTFTGALAADENLTDHQVEKSKVLQKILTYVVSVTCTFISLKSNVYKRAQLSTTSTEFSLLTGVTCFTGSSSALGGTSSESKLHWHQKAIVSVMEAGGLNWLVELLRVIRRLSMKEQWTDVSLQYLTLSTLQSALSENPRAQNHFRSIGGLEVLLDGLGLSSNNALASKDNSSVDKERKENHFLALIQLQVLSLEVLREAVYPSD